MCRNRYIYWKDKRNDIQYDCIYHILILYYRSKGLIKVLFLSSLDILFIRFIRFFSYSEQKHKWTKENIITCGHNKKQWNHYKNEGAVFPNACNNKNVLIILLEMKWILTNNNKDVIWKFSDRFLENESIRPEIVLWLDQIKIIIIFNTNGSESQKI